MGQPTAPIKKATVAPVIDGMVDDIWAEADQVAINVPFAAETPTVGDSRWKALWTDDGIYLLCFVDDDVFVPAYMGDTPAHHWNYDKLEIYFDCNSEKKDGLGGSAGQGHYQFAPTEIEAKVNGGTATVEANGFSWAFNATGNPKYYAEYFIPFKLLLDKEGIPVDKTKPIGFDVSIQDNDIMAENRNRMNWANAGAINDDWGNLDDAGLITLDGLVLSSKQLYANSLNVYPNPIGNSNQLNVKLEDANAKVTIYNAIGQKILEEEATGNIAKFDVSSLRNGLYFVRLADGTSQKLIK